MVQRILALTDLSEVSCTGLDLAESLARRLHGRVTVGYAHTRSDVLRDYGGDAEQAKRLAEWLRRDDEEHLKTLCADHVEKLRLTGIETVEAPNAREGVTALIERTKPELVCMATRGRTGLKHLLLGSIAEHAIRTSEVPVIVTKGRPLPAPEEPLRVMAGLDLVDDPLYLCRRLQPLLGSNDELILAHVVESLYYSPVSYGTEFSLPQPDVPKLVEAAESRLGEIDLGPEGPKIRIAVKPGRPGEALLDLEGEHEPHIVAVRTHGRRGFDRMMLGSVSEFLARKCQAAVVVFPKLG